MATVASLVKMFRQGYLAYFLSENVFVTGRLVELRSVRALNLNQLVVHPQDQ